MSNNCNLRACNYPDCMGASPSVRWQRTKRSVVWVWGGLWLAQQSMPKERRVIASRPDQTPPSRPQSGASAGAHPGDQRGLSPAAGILRRLPLLFFAGGVSGAESRGTAAPAVFPGSGL